MNVAAENNLAADIQKITDREKFLDYGIVLTSGLLAPVMKNPSQRHLLPVVMISNWQSL